MKWYPQEWADIVDRYRTCFDDVEHASQKASHANNAHGEEQHASAHARSHGYVSTLCGGVAFETYKQLCAHQRAKHGMRNSVVPLVGDISACPICGTDFRSRLRLMTHLSETRLRSKFATTTCRQQFLAKFTEVAPEESLNILNLRDRKARRSAYRSGRSHEIAVVPAKLSVQCKLAKAGNRVRRRIRGKTRIENVSAFYRYKQMQEDHGCQS